ncbi:hypothetical protein MC885_018967 [Smutsia gigantea]|nr:hypothetical protein MC885_018967 [Smutsia gigantea]
MQGPKGKASDRERVPPDRGLGSFPAPCRCGPCCHLGNLQDEMPRLAPFIPPLPPPHPSGWTHFSRPFLPTLPIEQQFPGSSKPDTLLPGPGGPPAAQHFPGLPLMAGLGQGAGERLGLLSLRPEGLELKPDPMTGAKGHLVPREGFSSETHGPKTGEESPVSPSLENFKGV